MRGALNDALSAPHPSFFPSSPNRRRQRWACVAHLQLLVLGGFLRSTFLFGKLGRLQAVSLLSHALWVASG